MRVGDVLRTVEDYEAVPIGGTVDSVRGVEWYWVRVDGGYVPSHLEDARVEALGDRAPVPRTVRSLPEPEPVATDLNQILDSLRDGDVVTAKVGDHTITGPIRVCGDVVDVGLYPLRSGVFGPHGRLSSVEVVSRALPDWAADNVQAILWRGCAAARNGPVAAWYVIGEERGYSTDQLARRIGSQDVEIVATFKDQP